MEAGTSAWNAAGVWTRAPDGTDGMGASETAPTYPNKFLRDDVKKPDNASCHHQLVHIYDIVQLHHVGSAVSLTSSAVHF